MISRISSVKKKSNNDCNRLKREKIIRMSKQICNVNVKWCSTNAQNRFLASQTIILLASFILELQHSAMYFEAQFKRIDECQASSKSKILRAIHLNSRKFPILFCSSVNHFANNEEVFKD